MQNKIHWENVYGSKADDEVSWYQPHAKTSLRLMQSIALPKTAAIIDVGGGASVLVDDLLDNGFTNITVLDISSNALSVAKKRLGSRSNKINWINSDIKDIKIPDNSIDLWHDRAVFHFLTEESDKKSYVSIMSSAVKPGGYIIIAPFAEDGPTKCSGLPVVRYSAESLSKQVGKEFALVNTEKNEHHTPSGNVQNFRYCVFKKIVI